MKKLLAFVSSLFLLLVFCCSCGLNAPISHPSSSSAESQSSSIFESSVPSSSEGSSSASSSLSSSSYSHSAQSSAPAATSSSDTDLTALPTWKRLYIANAQIFSKEYSNYALIDIDNNDIPELYMSGASKAVIYAMSTVNPNAAISEELNADNEAWYIPKSGKLMNAFVDGDHATMAIYRLDGHFQLIFQGHEYLLLNNDGSQSYLHYIDGSSEPISEDAFKAAVAQHFDTDRAVKVSDRFMSLEELKTAIVNW